jgi:hypothetical protein
MSTKFVFISSATWSEIFLTAKGNQTDVVVNVGLCGMYRSFVEFNGTKIFREIFEKLANIMKLRQVEAELLL